MQIPNPIQMNDWEIKKFLSIVLAIQLALWGAMSLDSVGIHVPLLRQIVSLIYLLYIPGILIMRILKLHRIGTIETLLYSVGLSIATLMFVGFLMNATYPLLGIPRPLSIVPLTVTLSTLVLALCIISYIRDRDFASATHIDIKELLSPPLLLLCLILFLSILGTSLVNLYQNNTILMLMIVVIGGVVLLIGFDRFIPRNLYPLAIFAIGLSLLFSRSLISMYISGFDIHEEYYFSNLAILKGTWDSDIYSTYNTMLSIGVLAPNVSIMSALSLTWVFKVIYPILYSLAPLGLYRIFQKQTDDNVAFLSCFFFLSVGQFYYDESMLMKQQIATLFLSSLLLLMIDKNMWGKHRSLLFIVFGVSLIVSHYGLSYIYMFYLIFAWLILVLADNSKWRRLRNGFYSRLDRHENYELFNNPIVSNTRRRTLNFTFMALFIVVTMSWYIYTSGSAVFIAYIDVGRHIARNINQFLDPETSVGLTMLLTQPKHGLLYRIHTIINYLNQVFIMIGILVLLLKYRELKFEKEYSVFSILALATLFAAVLVPFLTYAAHMSRLYHIALIFLSPFCVIGGLTVFSTISRAVKASWTNTSQERWLKILSVYFVIFFLYQIGFVWEVAGGNSGSHVLGQEWIKKYGDARAKAYFYNAVTPEPDVLSAKWLNINREHNRNIYSTYADVRPHALLSYGMIPIQDLISLDRFTEQIPEGAYVYLQYLNVVYGIGTDFALLKLAEKQLGTYNMTEISHLYQGKNKVYTNGGSEIYR